MYLRRSLQVLRTGMDNRPEKLYLGLNWEVPNAFTTKTYYNDATGFPKQGLRITGVDTVNIPFHLHFQTGDLLLSYIIQNKKTELGALQHQRTLGQLIYALQSYPSSESIKFYYIKINTVYPYNLPGLEYLGLVARELDILICDLNRYSDVHDTKDLVLIGGGG